MKTAGSAVTRRGLLFAYPHGSRHMVCMGSEHMQALEQACLILPEELGRALQKKPETEEIRMRLGRPPTALLCGKEQPLSPRPVDRPQMVRVLEAATGASFHAASTLQQGFVRFHSLRIGVCGEAASDKRLLPFFVGLRIGSISVDPGNVLKMRKAFLPVYPNPTH